jgi:hypothetical protein
MAMNGIDPASTTAAAGRSFGPAGAPAPDVAPLFEDRLPAARGGLPFEERSPRRQRDRPEEAGLLALLAAAPPPWATPAPTGAGTAEPPGLTPHDIAATVAAAWVETPPDAADASLGGSQWTFAFDDPLTPLAALRLGGDPAAGWTLRVTGAPGFAPQQLAQRAERLRRRLLARGQPVSQLDIDEALP